LIAASQDEPAVQRAPTETTHDAAARCFKAWKDGDPSAIDQFVRLVTPVLWQVVRAYGLDQSSAEDVVHTTWMTLIRKSAQVPNDQAVLRWLTITARREAWRVAQSAGQSSPTDDLVIELSLPAADSPESQVFDSQSQRQLWASLKHLDERCQRLLRVVASQGRPDYASLAVMLNMPIGSIGPARSRCLAKLRALLNASDVRRSVGKTQPPDIEQGVPVEEEPHNKPPPRH
jgi:RNA polymerase sigma factor (sigma-70 family)